MWNIRTIRSTSLPSFIYFLFTLKRKEDGIIVDRSQIKYVEKIKENKWKYDKDIFKFARMDKH